MVRSRILLGTLSFLFFCVGTKAIPASFPGSGYSVIAERNVFALKQIPEPVSQPISTPALPKIILKGITTILGKKMALLKVQFPALKPGEKPQEELLILALGESDGNIRLIDVDEKAGIVKVECAGTITDLAFETPLQPQ